MTSSRRAFTYVPKVLGGQSWLTLNSKRETSPTLRRFTSRTNGASGLPVRGCRDRATPPRCFSCSTVSPHAGHVACTQSDAAAVSREVGGEGMCGIVGIIKLNARETVDEARLKRMRDVLRHRGPDGEGLWIGGPVGLGMRRLAIVDVLGGRQPMANEDGTVWIVYNGEVYNHADLRPGLEQRGHCYRTRSDTETILHLYEEEGERCVERLQGMFAFALWDRRRGRFLSGGMDSSGLAALMAPMVKEPIRTFAVGFSDPEANELAYARLAAHSVGAEHRELVIDPAEFFGALPRLVWHEDEPITFPSSVALYFVSRLAREHVKGVLTG